MPVTHSMPKKLLRDMNALQALHEKLEANKNNKQVLDIDMLVEASEKSAKLFEDLWREFERLEHQPLKHLCDDLFKITHQLHSIASANNPKPSLRMLDKVTASFDNFLDCLVTKSNRKKFRKAIAKVRIVDDVLFHCGNIPHYWNDANAAERLGLIFGATLVVAAVSLTIAAFAAPAMGHTFGGGFGIGVIGSFGMFTYTLALLGVEDKIHNRVGRQKSLRRLEEQQKNLNEFVKNNLQSYEVKQDFLIKHHISKTSEKMKTAKVEPYEDVPSSKMIQRNAVREKLKRD